MLTLETIQFIHQENIALRLTGRSESENQSSILGDAVPLCQLGVIPSLLQWLIHRGKNGQDEITASNAFDSIKQFAYQPECIRLVIESPSVIPQKLKDEINSIANRYRYYTPENKLLVQPIGTAKLCSIISLLNYVDYPHLSKLCEDIMNDCLLRILEINEWHTCCNSAYRLICHQDYGIRSAIDIHSVSYPLGKLGKHRIEPNANISNLKIKPGMNKQAHKNSIKKRSVVFLHLKLNNL